MNRTLAALRALTALVLLVALTVGTPVALLRLGVLPHQWPTWSQTTSALSGPDSGQLFLGALTLLGWGAWLSFTLSAAVETLAAVRRRSAPRLPVLGATQRLAATLVSSIVLLLPATTALAATAAPAQASALHLPHASTSRDQAGPAVPKTAAPAAGGPTVTVDEPDQTLWSLAEQYLGSGMRWREIVTANQGVVQSDGTTLTSSTAHLVPGWKLRLPADARLGTHARPTTAVVPTAVPVRAAAAPEQSAGTGQQVRAPESTDPVRDHERTHVVRPGDTLSQIAESDLGNAADYPKIAAASEGTVQPDGRHLTNPDLIYPGWTLTIPQASAPGTPSTPTAGSSSTAPGSGTVSNSGTVDTAPPSASPTTPAPAATAPAPSTSNAPAAPTTAAAAGSTPTSAPTPVPHPTEAPVAAAAQATAADSGVPIRTGAGIAALLAAALLGGYGVKRALQQRRRRPGETIAMPEQTSDLERVLIHTATQATAPDAELLDVALRTLAAQLPAGTDLPAIDGARITPAGVALRCAGDPLPPFTSGPDGWWELDPAHELLDAGQARQHEPPYPLLTALGTVPEGGSLLADLRTARTVLLDGSPEQVREVARSIALEAASCPWGQDVQVLCYGITDPDLPAIVPTGRLQHLTQLSHAAKDLAELLLSVHQDPAASMPWVLVVADQADEQDAWQLADLVARFPHAPVALVLPAAGLDALFPEAAHLDCAATDEQPGPVEGQPVVLQRVTESAYQLLLADLRTTEQPAAPAQGAWAHVPQSTEPVEAQTRTEPSSSSPTTGKPDGTVAASPFLAFSQTRATGPADVPLPPSVPPASQELTAAEDNPASDPPAPAAVASQPAVDGPSDAEPPDATSAPGSQGAEPSSLHIPQVLVLGPLDITGLGTSGRGRRLAELAAYLYLHPNRTAEAIAEAIGSLEPWTDRTLRTRMSQLRQLLGKSPDGTPYVPYVSGNATYARPDLRCDWTRFLKLAERGLTAGPAGVADLESALGLVRGRPFEGSSVSWAVAEQQEMISRIVDVAHAAAVRHIAAGHWDPARTAISKGLHVEPTAELLYRDWITLEARRGDRAALGRVISDLGRALRTLDVEMDDETQTLITDIYARDQRAQGTA